MWLRGYRRFPSGRGGVKCGVCEYVYMFTLIVVLFTNYEYKYSNTCTFWCLSICANEYMYFDFCNEVKAAKHPYGYWILGCFCLSEGCSENHSFLAQIYPRFFLNIGKHFIIKVKPTIVFLYLVA